MSISSINLGPYINSTLSPLICAELWDLIYDDPART